MSFNVPSSSFVPYGTYDFNGRPPKDLSVRHAWIQGQAPMLPGSGGGGENLSVIPDVGGPASFVNQTLNVPGRGGILTNTINANTVGVADNRNYTPYTVGPAGPSLNSDDPAEYSSIQAAVDQAILDGASPTNRAYIWIKPGTYTENLVLDGSTILAGQSATNCIIEGTISIPGPTGPTFAQEFRDLTLLQVGRTSIIDAPQAKQGRIQLINFNMIITDPTVPAVNLVIPAPGDFFFFLCILGGIRTPAPTSPVPDVIVSTGNGRLSAQFSFVGFISTGLNLQNLAVGGSAFGGNNDYRFQSCVFTDSGLRASASATQVFFQGVLSDNSQTASPILDCAGYATVLGSKLIEARIFVPAGGVTVVEGSAFYRQLPLPCITADGDIYASANFIRNVAALNPWMVGTGTYYQAALGVGSNIFENLSSNSNSIAATVLATMN